MKKLDQILIVALVVSGVAVIVVWCLLILKRANLL